MKRRRWVLVIAFILGIIIFGGYFTWKITKADQKIKIALLNKARPFLADESDIEKISISLNSISLRGVKLAPKNHNYYVNIEEVRLGYNVLNLFKYRFALHKIPHQIVLVHPIFTIEKFKLSSKDFFEDSKVLDYKEAVKEFSRVKRVAVSDAEFFLQDSLGSRKRFANSLNGWLYSNSADSTIITLSGNLFGVTGSDNLQIESQVNLLSGEYKYVHINIEESDLTSSDIPFFLPEYLQVHSGKVEGEFNMKSEEEKSGYFTLSNSSFSFKNFGIWFNDVNIKTSINDSSILINGAVQEFGNTSLDISGVVENIVSLEVDLLAECSDIDFKTLSSSMFPGKDIPLEGKGDLSLHLTGPVNNPEIRGNLVSADFQTVGIDFSGFRIDAHVKNRMLWFNGVSRDSVKLDFVCGGKVDMSDTSMVSDLTASIKGNFLYILPDQIKKRLNSATGELDVWFGGELRNIEGEGESRISLVNKNFDRDVYVSHFNYNKKVIHFNTLASNSNFKITGEIRSPFRDNIWWRLQVNRTEYPFLFLLSDKYQSIADSLLVTTNLSGDHDSWTGEVIGRKLFKKDTLQNFVITPSYRNKRNRKEIICKGFFRESNDNQLAVELQADLTDRYLRINNFSFEDDVFISGEYPLHKNDNLKGSLKFQDFAIHQMYSLFSSTTPFKGKLNGDVELRGSKDSMEVTAAISINEGAFHNVDSINGEVKLKIRDENVELCTISLDKKGDNWFDGSMKNTEDDSLKGRFYSHWEKGSELIQVLPGFDFFRGRGQAELTVGGTNESPSVKAVFNLKDGFISKVGFNDLHVEIIDTLWKEFDISKGNLRIVKGRCYKNDGLKGLFWGVIPHSNERDSDVSLLIEGDIFGVLSELNDNIKNAKSTGELFLRVGENEGDWFIGSGRLDIVDGELSYLYPFDNLTEIQINAEIEKGNNFVTINKFSGKIHKSRIKVKNQPVSRDENIVPILLNKYRLSLGKLLVETKDKGIRFHIPGLMEGGEECWIDFKGFDPQDDFFTIAGSIRNPIFRGSLVLRDYRFTYPFITQKNENGSQSIFEKIFWDVKLYPKENVHYIKEITTPLGNFEVNLKLQDEYGGLRLQGCSEKDNLQVWGNLASIEGVIDVLGHYFRPERITFDYPQGAEDPIVYGKAYTTIVDSLGMRSTVWLAINTAEQNNGGFSAEGPWGNTQFRFYTNDPNVSRTNTEVLSLLEGPDKGLKGHAYEALGLQVENYILGPIIKPVEREIRRSFGLDLFHFSYMFGRNFFRPGSKNQRFIDTNNLIQQTKLTVGKYLGPNLFLTYSGQIQKGLLVYPDYGLGFKHSLSLEYMIHSDLFLEMEYTYNSLLLSDRQVDKRIWIRHVFPF
ncbi:MAG: hypothetical protein R6V04_17070 [bacterium]